MPELPEVETVVRDLRPCLVNRRIGSVAVGKQRLRRPWSARWNSLVCDRVIRGVWRRGKWIVLDLEDEACLVIHLGMTGQLVVEPARLPVRDHTHVIIGLEKLEKGTSIISANNMTNAEMKNVPFSEELRFRDVRRFGSMTFFPRREHLERFFDESGLGPEPFDLHIGYWRERLAATSRCLKAVLLDQRVVAGVGNIYADESLFQARLHPARLGQETTAVEAQRLRRAIVAVLNRAIEHRGATIRDYVGGLG